LRNLLTPKILIWDLETDGMNSFYADLGSIVNFGYKWLGEAETHVLKISDYKDWFKKTRPFPLNDKPLLKDALKIMEEADLLVAHYGDKFDRRFFNGRCTIHGLMPPPPTKQRDTWRIARTHFKFSSNRLGNVAQVLGVAEQKHQKGRDEWPGWWLRVLAGDAKAVEEMAEYCAQDVKTTEQVYLRIRQFDTTHPRLILNRDSCALCGGQIIYRGHAYVGIYKYPRFQCTSCGKWGRSPKRSAV
jgi:hypothetical protein